MYTTNTQDFRDEMSDVKRVIQLTRDYTTGSETFKKGSIGTVIEETTRKDRKLKVKLDKDTKKKYRLIMEKDLQVYPGMTCLDDAKLQANCQYNSQSTDAESYEY